jgi:hypothetical protein
MCLMERDRRGQSSAASIPRQFLPPKINQQHKEISIQADFVLDILLVLSLRYLILL